MLLLAACASAPRPTPQELRAYCAALVFRMSYTGTPLDTIKKDAKKYGVRVTQQDSTLHCTVR